jgi:succinoglycan biosynthesis transport protein ExoP
VPQNDRSEYDDTPLTLGQRIDFIRGFLHRRWVMVLSCLLIALPLGALYAFTSPKTYTASSIMMIETRKGPLEAQASASPLDAAWFETQLVDLRSLNVLSYVVKQLHLADDMVFLNSDHGLFDRIRAHFGWSDPSLKTENDRVGRAVAVLVAGLGAQRIGQSYMLKIDFRGSDPVLVAKIANAMVDAYIFDQTNAKYQSNRRADDWLQERLQNLRDQAAAAERAVVQFKAKNNIIVAGGTLINDKQLSELSSQLATAHARTNDLQARLARMDVVRQAYESAQPGASTDESISEAMSNTIIGQLRAKYLDLINREADWSARYGATHAAVVKIRNDIRDIRRSIADELGRIEETHKSELKIAKQRQAEVEKALADTIAQSQETSQAQVTLFSLEAQAKSYRSLYDNFLRQHTAAVQEETLPVTDARLVSSASVVQTGPNITKIWLLTIFAGGILGIGAGALREVLDRGFRTAEQVKSILNTDCLALVPRISGGGSRTRKLLPPRIAVVEPMDQSADRQSSSQRDVIWAAVAAPHSPYADAMRAIKFAIESGDQAGGKVVGLTSYLPAEGKSTVAAGIATLMAQSGRRTILIDCDVRNPSLSRALTPDATVGFLEVVTGAATVAQALRWDATTKMSFLPTILNAGQRNATEILASIEARGFIEALKSSFDQIIIDMAPLISTVDIRAISRIIDSYVMVVEWGTTKAEAVRYALENAPAVHARMIGAVLNKVDFMSLDRYQPYGYGHYYYGADSHPRH